MGEKVFTNSDKRLFLWRMNGAFLIMFMSHDLLGDAEWDVRLKLHRRGRQGRQRRRGCYGNRVETLPDTATAKEEDRTQSKAFPGHLKGCVFPWGSAHTYPACGSKALGPGSCLCHRSPSISILYNHPQAEQVGRPSSQGRSLFYLLTCALGAQSLLSASAHLCTLQSPTERCQESRDSFLGSLFITVPNAQPLPTLPPERMLYQACLASKGQSLKVQPAPWLARPVCPLLPAYFSLPACPRLSPAFLTLPGNLTHSHTFTSHLLTKLSQTPPQLGGVLTANGEAPAR